MIAETDEKPDGKRRTVEGCAYCEEWAGDSMMPWHDAGRYCESGKRPHCTCDACF